MSTESSGCFGLSPGKLAKMLPRAFWKSQTVLTPIQFELLIALNLIFCFSPKSVALGTSSGEPIDLASVNSSRTFPLSQRNVATNEEGRDENSVTNSLDLYSNSVLDIFSKRFDFYPGHLPYGSIVRKKHGKWAVPMVFRLYPRSGPSIGGTKITVHGARFLSTGREVCRFGRESDRLKYDLVRANILTETKLTCKTPKQNKSGSVAVAVSLDGVVFSGGTVSAVQGSGSFIFFTFTDHVPSGEFSIDNTTGPFSGGTQITVTLSATRSGKNQATLRSYFNFTKRVYLRDMRTTFSNDISRSEVSYMNESRMNSSNRYAQVVLEGTPYEVIYPTSGTLRELKLGAEHLSGDFPYRNSSLVDQKAVENAAIAMQNASRNMHGCISSTHKKTIDCLSSLEPHVLVTEKRVLEYTTNQKNSSTATYGRFEPSTLAKCMFSFPGKLWPFETSEHIIFSEIVTSPARWIGYNKIQCTSPQRIRPHPNISVHYFSQVHNLSDVHRNVTVFEMAVIRISNDGIHFSEPVGTFTFKNAIPKIFNVYTEQESGAHKARGPWSGKTEIYINGTDFLASDNLMARFVVLNETRNNLDLELVPLSVLEQRNGQCYFDTNEQIRCISPSWYPDEQLQKQTGSLAPCFRTNVEISNDGGSRWSSAEDKFLYCPIFVSTYGSNSWGEGTPRLPFRDLSRAIQASLSRPRSYFIRKGGVRHSRILGGRQHRGVERRGSGLVRYINLDQIYLMDGIYRDRMGIYGPEQNLNLAAHGRVIEVIAQNHGRAFIDCSGNDVDALRPFDFNDHHGFDIEQHGSISFKDVGIVRCTGSIRWEAYESNDKHELSTKHSKRRRVIPLAMMTICEKARHLQSDLIDVLESYVAVESDAADEGTDAIHFCHQAAQYVESDVDYIELSLVNESGLSVAMLTGTAISAFSVSNNHTSEGDGTSDASRRRLLLLRSSRLRLDAITFLSNAQLSAWMHRTYSKGNDESTAVDSGRKVFPAIPEHTKVQGGEDEHTQTSHLDGSNFRNRFQGSRLQ